MTIGIYLITNKTNGKVYVGKSLDIKTRLYCHQSALQAGTHNCAAMQKDWTNLDKFTFEILEECQNKFLGKREQTYIKELNSIELGYNTIMPTLTYTKEFAPVTFTLPHELKKMMEKTSYKNSSEFIREAIIDKLKVLNPQNKTINVIEKVLKELGV